MLRKALIIVMLSLATTGQTVWVLRPEGIGPVKIGMTLPQLSQALGEHLSMPVAKEDRACFYLTPKKYSKFSLMVEDSQLVRIDVDKAGISTAEGIHVGDAESKLKAIYGSALKIEPSQYSGEDGGHYLTVQSQDRRYGIRFETEKGKVTTFYAGTYSAIQYVEGCE